VQGYENECNTNTSTEVLTGDRRTNPVIIDANKSGAWRCHGSNGVLLIQHLLQGLLENLIASCVDERIDEEVDEPEGASSLQPYTWDRYVLHIIII